MGEPNGTRWSLLLLRCSLVRAMSDTDDALLRRKSSIIDPAKLKAVERARAF